MSPFVIGNYSTICILSRCSGFVEQSATVHLRRREIHVRFDGRKLFERQQGKSLALIRRLNLKNAAMCRWNTVENCGKKRVEFSVHLFIIFLLWVFSPPIVQLYFQDDLFWSLSVNSLVCMVCLHCLIYSSYFTIYKKNSNIWKAGVNISLIIWTELQLPKTGMRLGRELRRTVQWLNRNYCSNYPCNCVIY